MTSEQKEICIGLGRVSYLPASFDKRFGNNLHSLAVNYPEKELSEKQNEWMFRLLYKYRKQLPLLFKKYQLNPLCSKKEKRTVTVNSKSNLPDKFLQAQFDYHGNSNEGSWL